MSHFYCNLLKLISNIHFILVLSVVLLYVYPQVYALKEYINNEYKIHFQYPDEWQILDFADQDQVVEIENDIRIDLLLLRTEQKEGDYQIGEPAILIQVYPDLDDLKQLSKQVKLELLKDNLYDIVDYKKNYIGDNEYINITSKTTPEFYLAKLIETDLLYHNGNTGYRISYDVSTDLATKNTNNQRIMNHILENITQSISNNSDSLNKNYTKIIEQKFKGDNCPYSFCDLLVNVVFEGNNTIFLEGSTKTLTKDTQELTFSDIIFQSIELLQQDKFKLMDFENLGDGKFQVLLSK
jgi:hypothetical protein